MGHAFSPNTYLRSRTCWALVAAMLVALLLPGCSSSQSKAMNDPPKALSIKPVLATHLVYFDNGSAMLSPAEIDGLRAFLGEGRVTRIDSITVQAGDSQLGSARASRVSDALSNLGYTHVVAPSSQPGDDAVAVVVKRLAALPPACPDWAQIGQYDPHNLPMKNLGCANATNLFLMVADPRDLVSGRLLGPADGEEAVRSVDNYRAGKLDSLSWGPGGGSGGGASGGASSGGSSSSSSGGSSGQ
ncbi:MAG TPA: CpaD family pilus assembly lipoprotein [Stellaceae bacterium]|nr:CpaD family pilus assembly lipoprotein [Stellaceae bacterium]